MLGSKVLLLSSMNHYVTVLQKLAETRLAETRLAETRLAKVLDSNVASDSAQCYYSMAKYILSTSTSATTMASNTTVATSLAPHA